MAGALTNMIASIFSGSAVSTDPYFNLTTLLLSTTATNGQQNNTFQDSSTNNFTITRNPATGPNAPTQGTFSPFSQTGWGNYFDGTGDSLTVPDNAAFDLGGGAFTIEVFVYQTAAKNYGICVGQWAGVAASGSSAWALRQDNTQKFQFAYTTNGTTETLITSSDTFSLNTWNHVVAVRDSSNNTALFVNGSRKATSTTTYTIFNSTYVCSVGAAQNTTDNTQGYISNVRVVKGTAVYDPTQTTLVVPTAPLTAISGTSLLTCQSNRFIDNSSNNFTITRNGDTSVVPFSPFNPTSAWSASTVGGSGYFDGTGDYLTTPDNAAFNLGSSDFLIEAWVYNQSSTNFKMIMGQWNTGQVSYTLRQNASKWVFTYTTNGSTEVAVNGTSNQVLNAWTHLAVIRTGNTLGLFVNGTRETTASMTGVTIHNNTGVFSVGAAGNGGDLYVGYIGSSRLVLGTLPSGYDATQSTLTLPTAPFTSTAATSILLNFTNSGIYDATITKWSPTSMKFDGTGDYLAVPDSRLFDFTSSDWTIEFWMYRTVNATQTLITKRTSNAVAGIPNIFANTSNKIVVECSGQTALTPTGTISNNVWTHVAIVRSGSGSNNVKIYFNGTADATSVTWTTMATNTSPVYIGADTNGNGYTGYLQDIRISRYARYTANFSVPTAAFPVQ
jgi:Concanavalin A-like lectin/glucanases superfamily